MAELLDRINQLIEIATAENPSTPEWYIRTCVEHYISTEEPELALLKDQLPKAIFKGELIEDKSLPTTISKEDETDKQ